MRFNILSWLSRGAAASLALYVAGCGQPASEPTEAPTPAPAPTSPAPLEAQASLPISTEDFVQRVAISDMFEIEAGRLAQTRAANSAVRDFAKQMVQDHQATSARLKAAIEGQSLAIAPPTALDANHAQMLQDLRTVDAAQFDEKYVDGQVSAHEDALALMQGYAQSGDNDALRALAAQTAPRIQAHLDMIRRIDASDADEPPRAQ